MRNLHIITMMLLLSNTINLKAQNIEKVEKNPKYEISFDMFGLVANPTAKLSISFDYLLNESESIGIRMGFHQSELFTSQQNTSFLGAEYKHFFGKKYAEGFYMSTGLSFRSSLYHSYPYYSPTDYERINTLNIDFKIGYKLVSKRNFFLDSYIGGSQAIISSKNLYARQTNFLDFGINIGKRF